MRISIHALREEGDKAADGVCDDRDVFLSTPSARRATGLPRGPAVWGTYFYPRPPRGGRLPSRSISLNDYIFLSTPSARRATTAGRCCGRCYAISIHALREEGDRSSTASRSWTTDFYPRPPRGGRPPIGGVEVMDDVFLSTPSARRATSTLRRMQDHRKISIHALREEGDRFAHPAHKHGLEFLSTPSARRAT